MTLRIRSWPFKKDEEVELYWLCSPYFNREKGWQIKVAFKKTNNEIVEITVPWGTIPCLVIGQKYSNGLPSTTGKRGRIYEITIPERSIFETCIAYDIPSALYYFYKNQNYGLQKICRFSMGDRNFYIHCLEIVRTYLTPHKVLANCIMKPGGLDLLIRKVEVNGKDLYIDLTDEIPRRIVCDETAGYLAWLKFDIYANNAWNSIYNKIFLKAIEKSPFNAVSELQKGTYMEVLPPARKGTKWTFRGITVGKDTLIFELLSRTNLYMPFDNIYYSHSSLVNPEVSSDHKTIRVVKSKDDVNGNNVDLDKSGEATKKDVDQPVIEHISIGFSFSRNPKMKRVRKKNQKLRTGIPDVSAKIRAAEYGECNEIASTQDWVYGGQIRPIEFKTLEIVQDEAIKGLEEFLKVIDYIDKSHNDFKVYLNLVYIPRGKTFSQYLNGFRRNCAIVKVEREKKLPCYVIEVGRADGWSISTLIIYQLVAQISQAEIEEVLSGLLKGLIDNNGHWDKLSIGQEVRFRFDMMKHVTGQSILRWENRIIEKMM